MNFLKRLYHRLFIHPRNQRMAIEKATLGKKSLAILLIQHGRR